MPQNNCLILFSEEILFEPTYDNRQELQLNFYNVQEILMKNLMVQDTFKMHAENVKETRIMNSTFTHIPTKGMIISQAKLLDIQDSRFFRVYRQSIIVEKTKKVRNSKTNVVLPYICSAKKVSGAAIISLSLLLCLSGSLLWGLGIFLTKLCNSRFHISYLNAVSPKKSELWTKYKMNWKYWTQGNFFDYLSMTFDLFSALKSLLSFEMDLFTS